MKKKDYDTYENEELIRLNLRLFDDVGYKGNYMMEFSSAVISRIASVYNKVDKSPYVSFIQKCNEHRPWIWKDPRLWLTIRFWNNLLDPDDCKFILLTRDHLQSWISTILRRQIVSYNYNKDYNESIKVSGIDYFVENGLPHLNLCFEDLILHPSMALARLNDYLNLDLTIKDLEEIYSKPLYKNPRSLGDLLKAVLIYLKNYSERYCYGKRAF